MILNRGIVLEDLVLVRRAKPCTAALKVGDKVRLNSGGKALPVIANGGDDITVEAEDWRGRPEAVTMPRECWQKASVWNWLSWRLKMIVDCF